jgi:hypothetical protein
MRTAPPKTIEQVELEIAQTRTRLKIVRRSGDYHIESQVESELIALEETLLLMNDPSW